MIRFRGLHMTHAQRALIRRALAKVPFAPYHLRAHRYRDERQIRLAFAMPEGRRDEEIFIRPDGRLA